MVAVLCAEMGEGERGVPISHLSNGREQGVLGATFGLPHCRVRSLAEGRGQQSGCPLAHGCCALAVAPRLTVGGGRGLGLSLDTEEVRALTPRGHASEGTVSEPCHHVGTMFEPCHRGADIPVTEGPPTAVSMAALGLSRSAILRPWREAALRSPIFSRSPFSPQPPPWLWGREPCCLPFMSPAGKVQKSDPSSQCWGT